MAVLCHLDIAHLGGVADDALGLQLVGADGHGGIESHADAGDDSGQLDAGGVECSGFRVVFDDGAIGVFGAVEIRVVIFCQRLGELVSIEAADDIGIAQIAADGEQDHLLAQAQAVAGTVSPGPFCGVGPPVGGDVAGFDATLPGAHGGDGANADQVVDQAFEFDWGRLHGAIVLGNGWEGEGEQVWTAVAHWGRLAVMPAIDLR